MDCLNQISENSPVYELFDFLKLTEVEAKNWQEIRLYLQQQAMKRNVFIDLQTVL